MSGTQGDLPSTLPAPRRGFFRTTLDFWCRPVAAAPVALFRILIGTVLLVSTLSSLWPYLERYAGADGLCAPKALDDWLEWNGRFTVLRGPVSIPFLGTRPKNDPFRVVLPDKPLLSKESADAWTRWMEDPAHVRLLFWVWVGVLAAMTVGFCTRPATFLSWLLTLSFIQRLTWLKNGGDDILFLSLFYLMFTPSGKVWSLDRWLWRRRRSPDAATVTVPAWPIRLMQIQICMVYLFTGLVKVLQGWPENKGWREGIAEQDWLNGSAVYWVLNDVALNRFPYSAVPIPLFVCKLLSWGTVLFEIGFTPLVLFRRLRPWLLLGGIAFHLGIWIHTEVGYFSPAMLSWYVLFLPPGAVNRFFARFRRWGMEGRKTQLGGDGVKSNHREEKLATDEHR